MGGGIEGGLCAAQRAIAVPYRGDLPAAETATVVPHPTRLMAVTSGVAQPSLHLREKMSRARASTYTDRQTDSSK
eukprot:COSAG01_NODE_6505_length_3629_cov_6.178754_3_plen_75_part_00